MTYARATENLLILNAKKLRKFHSANIFNLALIWISHSQDGDNKPMTYPTL